MSQPAVGRQRAGGCRLPLFPGLSEPSQQHQALAVALLTRPWAQGEPGWVGWALVGTEGRAQEVLEASSPRRKPRVLCELGLMPHH